MLGGRGGSCQLPKLRLNEFSHLRGFARGTSSPTGRWAQNLSISFGMLNRIWLFITHNKHFVNVLQVIDYSRSSDPTQFWTQSRMTQQSVIAFNCCTFTIKWHLALSSVADIEQENIVGAVKGYSCLFLWWIGFSLLVINRLCACYINPKIWQRLCQVSPLYTGLPFECSKCTPWPH